VKLLLEWKKKGYKLVGIKMVTPDEKLSSKHYEDLKEKPFFKSLIQFFSNSGPVVAMVFEGSDVINYSRKMIGKTNPLASEPGTIRGDFAISVDRNVIHGSDGADGAKSEIPLWFKENEIQDWNPSLEKWNYDK